MLVKEQAPHIKVKCRGKVSTEVRTVRFPNCYQANLIFVGEIQIPIKGKGNMTTFWIGDYKKDTGGLKLVQPPIPVSGTKSRAERTAVEKVATLVYC